MKKYLGYNEEANARSNQLSTIIALLISVMLIANITIMIFPGTGSANKPDFEIFASEFVLDAHGDGLSNDAVIYVCDSNWNDVDSAKVYINNEWKGDTNTSGFLLVNDLRDGRYFVDVSYTNGTNVTFWAHTDFIINAIGEYSIFANATVFASDLDALENDVRIKVNDSYNENISGAYVYIDGKWVNNTNASGMIIIKDLPDGHYSLDVGYTNETGIEFWDSIGFMISAGGEFFIYANAYVLAADGDKKMNDTAIYVYNDDNNPVEFADIFINGEWAGLTNGSGGILIKDLGDGYYQVDASKNVSNIEYWAGAEFKINVSDSFIYTEAFVLAAYGGWEPNDVRIYVYDHKNDPVGGAEVYVGWDMGYTADNGSITFHDLEDGMWIIDVYYMNEFGEVLWAMAEVLVDVGHVIYPDVYVEPKDPDGIPNDIGIWVFDGNWSSVGDADVYLDGVWVNTTDQWGGLVIKDIDSGSHVIDVFYYNDILGEEFSGSREFKIDLDYFIYAEAYVIAANGREPNDVKIYVYDNDDNPLENANVCAGGRWGTTAPNGSVTLYDLGDNLWQATVYSMNESGEWHWAWIDFMIDIGHVIYPDVYVEPMDPDGMPNDVNVWVVDNNWSSVNGAELYLDGDWVNVTNEYGACIVKNIDAGPHILDVYYYDNLSGEEYWGSDEFVIDTGYYIYAEAFVFPASGGMEPDDVRIYVYDNDGNPLEGANVFAGGKWGETAVNGSVTLYDLGDNLWKATVSFINESGDWHWAWIEFMIDVGHVIYADIFVGPNGTDGIPNDVKIWVYDNDWMSVPYADVYLNGDWVGSTNGEGNLDINDLDSGIYVLDVFYYDDMYGEEYRGTAEFMIDLEYFIYVEAFVYSQGGQRPDDVKVFVYDNEDNPIEGANVWLAWMEWGLTAPNGSTTFYNIGDGLHRIDVSYFNETGVEFWSWTEVLVEVGHVIYADVFVGPNGSDGIPNDVSIWLYDNDWMSVPFADVYLNGDWVGFTDAQGKLDLNDLDSGMYVLDVFYYDAMYGEEYRGTTEFMIDLEYFIYVEAFVFSQGGQRPDDVKVYVYDNAGNPIGGVNVWLEWMEWGLTAENGSTTFYNVGDGMHRIDVSYFNETGVEFWSWTEILVDVGHVIYADVFVGPNGSDGIPNDVSIWLYDNDWMSVPYADVYLNGDWVGFTDAHGKLDLNDLDSGMYVLDVFYYDAMYGEEYRGTTEFQINLEYFIYVEAFVYSQGGQRPDDVKVHVYDNAGNPIGGANVWLEWMEWGMTAENGSTTFYNVGDGMHRIDVSYFNETGVEFWSWTEVLVDVGHVIYADVFVGPNGSDGIPNDVSIWLYDNDWMSVPYADVYLNGDWVGFTDAHGKLDINDLDSGMYVLDVFYYDAMYGEEYRGTTEFMIDLEYFIYVEAFVYSQGGQRPDDVKVYVYDNAGNPIGGVNVWLEWMEWGMTAENGSTTFYNVGDGMHRIDVSYFNETGFEFWSWTEVLVDVGHVIYADVFVGPNGSDGIPNDVSIWLYDNDWMSVPYADVYLNGDWVGFTDAEGNIHVNDLDSGMYVLDVFYYDAIYGEEYRGTTEFMIDLEYFIYVEAFVYSQGGQRPDDVKVHVYDNAGNPIAGANVWLGWLEWGLTAENGSTTFYNIADGLHRIDVSYFNETGFEFWSWTEVLIDLGHVIYADVFVGPNGSDGIPDDVSIWLYDNDWMSVAYADVYLNGDWVGFTDGEGNLDINDLDPGLYLLDVFYYDAMFGEEYHGTTEFQINLDFYIYAEAFVYPMDADLVANDVIVYLYDNAGNPIEGASVFINWAWMGSTSENGSVLVKDLEDDWYSVDIHYWNDTYVDHWAWTEFIIEMEHIIYADVFVFPGDPNGIPNDVEVYVYDGNGSPLESAEVYINNEWAGLTDKNGSIAYKDLENASYIVDIFYYDMLNMKEYWTKTEFIISAGEKFIFTDVYVYPADGDGILNDLEIHVYDFEGNPQVGAEIYIDSMWYGMTGENGSLWSLNFSQGWHYVDIFIYGEVAGNDSNFSVDFQAWAEFYIGDEGYLWLDAFVLDHNNDSYMNDVKIRAYTGDNDVLPYADVYVDEYWEGMTDLDGELVVENISRGWHEACVISDNRFGFIWFYSEGADEQYIYIEHFVKDIIPENITDDAIIYVYDQDDNPVAFAEVYVDGYLVGFTSTQGYITSFDLVAGYHFVDVYFYKADWNYSAYAWTEIWVGEDYHYGDAYGNDDDGDNYTDDGEIWVYDDEGNPIDPDDYNATVDGEPVEGNESTRNDVMSLKLSDLPAGLHFVTIYLGTGTRSDEPLTFEFISEGTGEAFIYTKALTVDADEDGAKDDSRIYVYDENHEPVAGADVYVDGLSKGQTNSNGYIDIIGISSSDFSTGTHSGYASYDQLECGIEGPKVDVVVEPPKPDVRIVPSMTIGKFTIDVKHAISGDLTLGTATSPGFLPSGLQSMGLYFNIESTMVLKNGEWIYIAISYNGGELPEGVDEGSLALYYWDVTASNWFKCANPGIDVGNDILWANVSHLTVFTVFAKEIEPAETVDDDESSSSYLLYIVIVVLVVIGILFVVRSLGKGKEGGPESPQPEYELEDEEDSDEDGLFRDWVDFEEGGWDYDEDAVEVKEESIGADDEYGCPDCGETLEADDDVCPGCGSVFDDDDEFSEDDDIDDIGDDAVDDNDIDDIEKISEEDGEKGEEDEFPIADDVGETENEDDWDEDVEDKFSVDADDGEEDVQEDWVDSDYDEDDEQSSQGGNKEEEFVG